MKWLWASLFILVNCFVFSGAQASALDATPFESTPQLPDSPVIIVAYSLTGGTPGYVELFNSSAQPVSIEGWRVEYITGNQTAPILLAALSGWIAPSNYVAIADATMVSNADFLYQVQASDPLVPKNLRLVPSGAYSSHEVAVDKDGQYQRKVSATTGNYLSTFESVSSPIIYRGGFYTIPDSTGLQFSEILAHPRTCSPLDTALDCADYVKVYNPSSEPIDLSLFRLRVGYKGQASSSSNTYELVGTVEPGHFATITNDRDGRLINVTNSGGFVWLEDTYGIIRYDSTVQSYEDASADSKKGQAWAYDASDGLWKWTTRPTPGDIQSVFPSVIVSPAGPAIKTYTPCKMGQYRSEETHRCRSAANASAAMLKPCLANQIRNSETNRCRSLASASASSLKPCAAGQERNPETNRCRKAASDIPKSAFSVEPVADAGKAFAGWWALGGVGTLAVGYGVWEWRRDMVNGMRKIATFFTSGK